MTDEQLAEYACWLMARVDETGQPCRWVFEDSTAGRIVAILARRLNAERRPLPVSDAVVDG